MLPHPNGYVVERIARSMDRYVNAFGLFDSNRLLNNVECGMRNAEWQSVADLQVCK
jgi:hypothetical protein